MITTLASIFSSAIVALAALPAATTTYGTQPGFWFRTWLGRPTQYHQAEHTDFMFMWLWWFCVVWFVFLMGLMFYFVIVYRRKPGQIAQRSTSHHTPLEVVWTIIPTLFLVWIFWEGFRGYMDKVVAPDNAMELKVTGYKWSWDMEYPGGVVVNRGSSAGKLDKDSPEAIPVFYIPESTPIRLRMNSTDVMHAFWIPNFRVKADLVPNRYTGMYFKANALDLNSPNIRYHPKTKADETWNVTYLEALAGVPYEDHWVFCAEYCGTSHSEMAAILRVVPQGAYNAWLSNQANPADLTPVELGARVYKARCATCHSVDGSPNTGPTWKNLYGYSHNYTDGSAIVSDDNHIAESIRYPNRHIRSDYPAGGMSAFSESLVSAKQLDALIAYMKTLSDKAPAQTPEEANAPAAAPTPASAPPK